MANPIDPIKNLARFLAKSKVKDRLYHTTDKDFNEFKTKKNKPVFLTPSQDFANEFAALKDTGGANIMPVYVQTKNPFDFENAEHMSALQGELQKIDPYKRIRVMQQFERISNPVEPGHNWRHLEREAIQKAIKDLGHDAFYVDEGGTKNLAVFNPNTIKSAIGNRGTFDPLEVDITKAEGGTVNPIKTPREMLFEMLNLPRMAGGRSVEQAFTLADMVKRAIKEYIIQNKKQPSAQEIADLKAYAQTLSQPTSGLRTGPSAVPRAQYEMAKDPNLVNPNAPDEFMMQAMLGRGQKGTRLTPKVYDVNDPVTATRIEGNQLAGAYDDMLEAGKISDMGTPLTSQSFGSLTPGADFFATRAGALENTALGSGKIPLIDQLKMKFKEMTGRYPNEDELNAIIAENNPMRHQYGPLGNAVVGSRPATAKGGAMETWRQAARNEGIPEKYVSKSPADYSQALLDELSIQRGQLPGVAQHKARTRKGSAPTPGSTITKFDEQGNPLEVQNFRDGGMPTPSQMRWDMAAMGGAPSAFADPYQMAMAERAKRLANPVSPSALARMKASAPARVAGKLGSKAMQGLNVAAVPFSAYETGERFSRGDYPGAFMSGISTAANAAALHPALTLPASGVAMAAEGANMLRDYLTAPRSVMEEIK